MAPAIERWRSTDAGNLTRYRVLGGTRLIIREGFAMTVAAGFIIGGGALLSVQGILVVSKKPS